MGTLRIDRLEHKHLCGSCVQPDEEADKKATPAIKDKKADLDDAKSRLGNLREQAKLEKEGSAKPEVDEQEEVEDPNQYAMERYGDKCFNLYRKGMLKQKSTVEKMLRWKADTMKMSLTKLSDDLSNEAVQVKICVRAERRRMRYLV